jgi:hypothetical protein
MQAQEQLGQEQIRAFVEASVDLGFQGRNRDEVYSWVYPSVRGATPLDSLAAGACQSEYFGPRFAVRWKTRESQ